MEVITPANACGMDDNPVMTTLLSCRHSEIDFTVTDTIVIVTCLETHVTSFTSVRIASAEKTQILLHWSKTAQASHYSVDNDVTRQDIGPIDRKCYTGTERATLQGS
jgi:hypothetical protein